MNKRNRAVCSLEERRVYLKLSVTISLLFMAILMLVFSGGRELIVYSACGVICLGFGIWLFKTRCPFLEE